MSMSYPTTSSVTISMTLVLLLVFGLGLAEPTLGVDVLPPGSLPTLSPIHSGLNTQTKLGTLIVGPGPAGGTRYLCLNAPTGYVPADHSTDPTYCISSWSSFRNVLGAFVDVSTTGAVGSPMALNSYTSQQIGFIDVTAKPIASGFLGQSAAFIVRAPIVSGETGTAVFATSDINSRAGVFNGTVYVTSSNMNGNNPGIGQICLGPSSLTDNTVVTSDNCISSWNQIAFDAPDYVRRFDASLSITCGGETCGNPQITPGNGALISGSARFGGIIVGRSNLINNISFTCGNGICETSEENSASCAVDCNSVATPSIAANVTAASTLANGKIEVKLTAGGSLEAVTLLVIRSSNPAPAFRPVDGVVYPLNTFVLGDRIIRLENMTAGTSRTFTDVVSGGLQSGTSYFYQVYQYNAFPRYSIGSNVAAVTPYQVTLSINTQGSASYAGTVDPPLNISYPARPSRLFNAGTVDTYVISNFTGSYCSDSWEGCTQIDANSCSATITGDLPIKLNTTTACGGGGGEEDPGIIHR